MPRYIQDRATGKLVEAPRVRVVVQDAPAVVGDIEPFVSPLTRDWRSQTDRDLR